MSSWPLLAAHHSGVRPCLSAKSNRAFFSTSRRTMSSWPLLAAHHSGVRPCLSAKSN
ncbi:hypothetical protein BKA67DRAFT_579523, partial [Truncatella angustata]